MVTGESAGARSANALLASLTDEQWSTWEPFFKRVDYDVDDQILVPGRRSKALWFPVSGVFYQSVQTVDGDAVNTAFVGCEGVIALPSIFEVPSAVECRPLLSRASALRIETRDFRRQSAKEPVLRRRVMSYTGARLAAMAQGIACARLHTVEQRLATCLLTLALRTRACRITLTQESLALILGARRPSVTDAISDLTRRRIITHRRGAIEILDLRALADVTCECFQAMEDLFKQVAAAPV